MKKPTTMFLGGFLSAAVIFGALPAVAANIEAKFNSVNIEVNGVKVAAAGESYTLANGTSVPNSISYADTTYLPLRKVGEMLGLDVSYDGKTNTAVLQESIAKDDTSAENKSTEMSQSMSESVYLASGKTFQAKAYSLEVRIGDTVVVEKGATFQKENNDLPYCVSTMDRLFLLVNIGPNQGLKLNSYQLDEQAKNGNVIAYMGEKYISFSSFAELFSLNTVEILTDTIVFEYV